MEGKSPTLDKKSPRLGKDPCLTESPDVLKLSRLIGGQTPGWAKSLVEKNPMLGRITS